MKARGKAKKKLNRRGEVQVKARVIFTPEHGCRVTESNQVTLVKR